MRVSPFPKSTKTSAYVGQWGRLRFEGGSITTNLQVKQNQATPNHRYDYTKECLSVTKFTRFTIQIQKYIS
jgi:hypothetical protein